MRKWFRRILGSIAMLLLLLAAALQVLLWTDLPKNWVLAALQEKLRLHISAQQFSTGWKGHTELSGVAVGIPLEDKAILQIPKLSIDHTSVLGLIFGRPLRVEAMTLDRPNLLVQQQPSGRWNLEDVAASIGGAGLGGTADVQTPEAALPPMPAIRVSGAIVRLVDKRGRQATLSPLEISAGSQGTLVWTCQAVIPGELQIKGEVVPGGAWRHKATIELTDLASVIRPFIGNASPAALDALAQFKLAGQWRGQVSPNLTGRLDLTNADLSGYTASGPVAIAIDQNEAGGMTLTPAGLVITPPAPQHLPPGRFEGGKIDITAQSVTGTGLTVAVAGGELRLAGQYGWNAGEGKLQANWNNLILPEGTAHGGALAASLRQPWPNQPVIDVALTSHGQIRGDAWTAALKLEGMGAAWDHIHWKLTAPTLVYQHAAQTYSFDNLTATLATRGHLLTLDTLSLPPGLLYGKWQRGQLSAAGQYDLANGNWNTFLAGTGWPVVPGAPRPADFRLDLSGDAGGAHLAEFFLDGKRLRLWASGDLSYAKGKPVELYVCGSYPPVDYTWHDRDGALEDIHLSGSLYSELHLTKNAWPLDLKINGTVYGKHFKIKDRDVGEVVVKLDGTADPAHAQVETARMELLGGVWDLHADLRYRPWLTKLQVALKDLSLAQLDHFIVPPPGLRGTMAGRWDIQIPDFDAARMTAGGECDISGIGLLRATRSTASPDLVASLDKPSGGSDQMKESLVVLTAPKVSVIPLADAITGTIAVADGLVTLDPIRLVRTPEHGNAGTALAKVSFPIFSPRQMRLEASATAWPILLSNSGTHESRILRVSGQTRGLELDLPHLAASGPVVLDATFSFKDQSIKLHLDSRFDRRKLMLSEIHGDAVGGRIEGDGTIDFDHPLLSSGRIQWQGVQAQSILALAPALNGLEGQYSGAVRFAPTDARTDRDATGPFAVSGELRSSGGSWKGLPIGDAEFIAHGDYHSGTRATGPSARAVVDRLRWDLAGGHIVGWSRVTWYDLEPYLQVNVDFDKLSLDQIVKAARPAGQVHKPIPGLLSGTAMAVGNPFTDRGRDASSGEATVRLTDSDLANVKIVNLLYSIMSVQLGPSKPTGKGFIEARLEGKRLEIPVMRYFNRGADLWANAAVVNIFDGDDSPIEGTAAGSIKPLRELKLPFMADVDKIISALSGSVATVKLQGAVGEPDPKVIPFSATGEAFRRFMVGEVKNEVRGTSGR